MRNELNLRAKECFQEGAGESCVLPTMIKFFYALFLIRNGLLAPQYVLLGFCQMLKLPRTIHDEPPSFAGGSAIGLSATGAYGPGRCR